MVESEENKEFSCSHYKRNCEIQSPCCQKWYMCRLCHDDQYRGPKAPKEFCKIERMDRYAINTVRCLFCKTEQKPQQNCSNCQKSFGKYYCDVCHLFDDSDKKIFHCDKCKICRVGKQDENFHCDVCNGCFHISSKKTHKCYEKALEQNCPVCLENLFYSRKESTVFPKCKHWLHVECFQQFIQSGLINCPVCGQAIAKESNEQINEMDQLIKDTQHIIPKEYIRNIEIFCNNCMKKSKDVPFHPMGLKCKECGSYNTKQ